MRACHLIFGFILEARINTERPTHAWECYAPYTVVRGDSMSWALDLLVSADGWLILGSSTFARMVTPWSDVVSTASTSFSTSAFSFNNTQASCLVFPGFFDMRTLVTSPPNFTTCSCSCRHVADGGMFHMNMVGFVDVGAFSRVIFWVGFWVFWGFWGFLLRAASAGRVSSGPEGRDCPVSPSIRFFKSLKTRICSNFCGDNLSQYMPAN